MEHNAATCCWATPVLFLAPPLWYEAEDYPWACIRGTVPRFLETTAVCATCANWTPRQPDEAATEA
jgi:hypothetical protein